jgi:hypothetical protein
MDRKAEVSLYHLFNIEGTHRYVRIMKSGRGWAPKTQPVGKPGSFETTTCSFTLSPILTAFARGGTVDSTRCTI